MGLRRWVDRVPKPQATRGSIARAALWLSMWLIALFSPLHVVPGGWALWSLAAIGWVRVVPLFTALAALFGLARWGMLATSVVYATYCFYLIVAFRIMG